MRRLAFAGALGLLLAVALSTIAYAYTVSRVEQDDAAPIRGNFTLERARDFTAFPVYYAGETFEGLPLSAVNRTDAAPYPDEPVRRDDVTFVYGSCAAGGDSGCLPPLQIQNWNACERHRSLYPFPPEESLTVRGVPAAVYDRGRRLELQTGAVTIVLFGTKPALVRRAAEALRGVNSPLSASDALPPPAPGALDGTLRC